MPSVNVNIWQQVECCNSHKNYFNLKKQKIKLYLKKYKIKFASIKNLV